MFKYLKKLGWFEFILLVFLVVSITVTVTHEIDPPKWYFSQEDKQYWFISYYLVSYALLGALIFNFFRVNSRRYELIPFQMLSGASMLFVYAALMIFTMSRLAPQTSGPYSMAAIIFTGLVAIVGWSIHIQLAGRRERKNHTLNILLQSRLSAEFQKHRICAESYYPIGKDFPQVVDGQEICTLVKHSASLQSKPIEHLYSRDKLDADEESLIDRVRHAQSIEGLRYLLNYYEFLAVGILKDDLDEELLFLALSGIVISLYKRTKNYREYMGKEDEGIWCNFIDLAERWKDINNKGKDFP